MAILRAKLIWSGDGNFDVAQEHRYQTVWRVWVSAVGDTARDVMLSNLIPQLGDPYRGWVRQPDGSFLANASPKDENSVLVFAEPTRLADDGYCWDVRHSYEGINDVTAIPARVRYDDVPYQESQIQDVNGVIKTNSALEAYEEGTEVDRNRLRLTIVRNIPDSAWDPDKFEKYKNTLNKNPFTHGRLTRIVGGVPTPITSKPGTVKLTSITAEQEVRLKHPNPLLAKYYWVVSAVLDIDYSKYTDNNGNRADRLWQRVLIDAGYNERLADGTLTKIITNNAFAAAGPQLLDGLGRRLLSRGPDDGPVTPPLGLPVLDGSGGLPVPNHDWYAARGGVLLTVEAPGVLANDYLLTAGGTVALVDDTAHGTLNLSADGSFTYLADVGYNGWDYFTYTVTEGSAVSAAARVYIHVGAIPRVRVFQDYPWKDWSELAGILGGW